MQLLTPRASETDAERQLRERLNRHAEGFMQAIDGAISLRSAKPDASRLRALARNDLMSAALKAMEALAIAKG